VTALIIFWPIMAILYGLTAWNVIEIWRESRR
jgi:hypothetical protein